MHTLFSLFNVHTEYGLELLILNSSGRPSHHSFATTREKHCYILVINIIFILARISRYSCLSQSVNYLMSPQKKYSTCEDFYFMLQTIFHMNIEILNGASVFGRDQTLQQRVKWKIRPHQMRALSTNHNDHISMVLCAAVL